MTFGVGWRKKEYIVPGLGANNPIQEVIIEAHSLLGGDSTVGSLLSIGNGEPGIIVAPLDGDELELYKTMRDVMEDCSQMARETETRIGRAGIYSRFSVEQGMQKAYDATDPAWIVTQTESYLEHKVYQLETFVKNNKTPPNIVTLNQLSEFNSHMQLFLS